MKVIENRLREFRKQKGLTQQDVADYLGLKSSSRIAKWENGHLYPHVKNFIQLLKLYEVSAEKVYENYHDTKIL